MYVHAIWTLREECPLLQKYFHSYQRKVTNVPYKFIYIPQLYPTELDPSNFLFTQSEINAYYSNSQTISLLEDVIHI